MRIALFLLCPLAACVDVPRFDASAFETDGNYAAPDTAPGLVPLETIMTDGTAEPDEDFEAIEERARNLRSRADALRRTP